jgi:hypothetical protein
LKVLKVPQRRNYFGCYIAFCFHVYNVVAVFFILTINKYGVPALSIFIVFDHGIITDNEYPTDGRICES